MLTTNSSRRENGTFKLTCSEALLVEGFSFRASLGKGLDSSKASKGVSFRVRSALGLENVDTGSKSRFSTPSALIAAIIAASSPRERLSILASIDMVTIYELTKKVGWTL